jgi:nucleotide-binding universal stress UspA family protein
MKPTISRILVPVDFSAYSDRALDYAAMLAEKVDASLYLLHVVDVPPAPAPSTGEFYGFALPELEPGLVAEVQRQMGDAVARLAEAGMASTHVEVRTGPTATTIVNIASKEACDLIVMGSHGRTGLAHLFMGSVAERVTRTAPCPVLTVRETAHAAPSVAKALTCTVV